MLVVVTDVSKAPAAVILRVKHRQIKHNIDWDSAECITYCTNYKQRITLESWYAKPITTTTGTLQETYSQHGPNKETITLLTNHA